MSIPTHIPHQQPSSIAASTPSTIPNSSTTSNQVFFLITNPPNCLPGLLDLFFATLRSLLDHHAPLLTKINKSSRTAPTPWITPEILSLKSARRRLERTYIASHSIFDLKLLLSSTNCYHKFIAVAKKLFYAALVQSSSSNLELFGKPSITFYTELQIAPYSHHPFWLPYHSYLPHTSLIKLKASFQPTNQPLFHPSSFSPTFSPSSIPLFHTCHLTRNRQSTLSII